MKKYLIPTVAVILVLVVAWTAFGQAEESGRQRGNTRGRFQNMSEEERAKMRERFQNMSAEDREKLRAQMRAPDSADLWVVRVRKKPSK
jgi:hypothetical protein